METNELKWKSENVVNMDTETLTKTLNKYEEQVRSLSRWQTLLSDKYNKASKQLAALRSVLEAFNDN